MLISLEREFPNDLEIITDLPFELFCLSNHLQSPERNLESRRTTANMTTMNAFKIRDYQTPSELIPQFPCDDFRLHPFTAPSKKKKGGTSDPRFKRVLQTEVRSSANAEKFSTRKTPQASDDDKVNEDESLEEKVLSYLKTPNEFSMFSKPTLKLFDDAKENYHSGPSGVVTNDVDFECLEKYYQDSKTAAFVSDNLQDFSNYYDPQKEKSNLKANLKRSASDCTLCTKNGFREETLDETAQKVCPYPSTARMSNAHDWIKKYKTLPEKRRSVITVIGQTQTKPFSKIFSEINQRRKLAKELDRHALCEGIMEPTEVEPDTKNLVAKVDFVLPDGKVIYSTEKVYLCKDSNFKTFGTYSQKSMEFLDAGDQRRKRCEMIPERDSSVSQIGKKNKVKRSSKRLVGFLKQKPELKGKLRCFYERFLSVTWWWSFLSFLCLALVLSTFALRLHSSDKYYLAELFKPKATTWYEKLFFS